MKKNNLIWWAIGAIILIIILNHFGVFDANQTFSVVEDTLGSPAVGGGTGGFVP